MIPTLGDTGLFKLNKPYCDFIDSSIMYKCIAKHSISDYVIKGEDIKKKVYLAYNLTDIEYENAIKNNEVLVTLQSTLGNTVMVPSSYILSMPDPNGRAYHNLTMNIELGALPINIKLGTLAEEVKEYIAGRLGMTPKIIVTESSAPTIIPREKHIELENKRYRRITNNESLINKYNKLFNDYNSKLALIKQLEKAIVLITTELSNPEIVNPEDGAVDTTAWMNFIIGEGTGSGVVRDSIYDLIERVKNRNIRKGNTENE